MAVEGLYGDGAYQEVEDLIRRALAMGAKRVEARGVGWLQGPFATSFQATATLVTQDGCEVTRDGYAQPGDAQADDAAQGEQDLWVQARAESRALRAAIRTAFPESPQEGSQSPAMKRLQTLIREVATVKHLDRGQVARWVAERFGVGSTAELDDRACDRAVDMLQGWAAVEAAVRSGARQ